MDDFLEFFRARLDEEDKSAKGATGGGTPWRMDGSSIVGRSWRASASSTETLVVRHTWPQEAAHIIRWQPNRVLALTAVLRRMVDEFSYEGRETAMLIELGAALYGDHPDFRPEWRGPSHVPTNEVLDMGED